MPHASNPARASARPVQPVQAEFATPLEAWRKRDIPREVRELGERLVGYEQPLSRDEASRLIDYVKRNMPELRNALSAPFSGYPEDQVEALKAHADWAFAYATSWPQDETGQPSELLRGADASGRPVADARAWHEMRKAHDDELRAIDEIDREEAETLGLNAVSPPAAQRRLSRISVDEPDTWAALNDRNHAGHAAALEEWNRLQRLAHGEAAVSSLVSIPPEREPNEPDGGGEGSDAPASEG